ncbi:Uncharacterised protein [Mycobacterium tuberculosis]|uniref:Uncharacterized protein n=1 Tax=Mycobacterium tuberculosis TaxID=1773 RepID=A0A916LBM5_MYCTX|nr:Uncharacterised protein [Mycobacterium tuberculosis]
MVARSKPASRSRVTSSSGSRRSRSISADRARAHRAIFSARISISVSLWFTGGS